MAQQDTLLTMAESAATFVGFSTIVVVFRSSGSELQRLYLLDVAILGLLVTALSVPGPLPGGDLLSSAARRHAVHRGRLLPRGRPPLMDRPWGERFAR